MARQFEATWSSTYTWPGTRVVSIEYFLDPDMKYKAADVQQINALEVGDTLELNGPDHTVKRIANS